MLGGAGFVGSHLVDALVSTLCECEILVLDSFIYGDNITVSDRQRVRVVQQDASDSRALASIMAGFQPHVVFHLAANSDIRASISDPNIDLRNTFGTTAALVSGLHRIENSPRVVFSSTSAIYGRTSSPITSQTAHRPESSYGWMKLASEALLWEAERSGLISDLRILRFPNVTGRGQTHGVVRDLWKKAELASETLEVLGDGRQSKPYVHVKDLVSALLVFASDDYTGPRAVNFGPSSQTSVSEIARLIVEESGKNLAIAFSGGEGGWPGDVPNYQYDATAIPEALACLLTRDSTTAIVQSIKEEASSRRGE